MTPAGTRGGLERLDTATGRWMRARPHWPIVDRLLAGYSRAGEHAGAWLVAALVGALGDRRRGRQWLGGAGAVAASEAASQAIKRRVRRRRPEWPGLPPLAATPSRYSFPSAHTASVCAAAVTFPTSRPRTLRLSALAMAASRPYLGVHYPSDVLAGALLGVLIGRAARSVASA